MSFSRKPLAPAWRASKTFVQFESGQHDRASRVEARIGCDLPGRLETIHARHADVHQHDIRPLGPCELDRLGAVAGLADDLEFLRAFEEGAKPRTHEGLVVREQNPDGHDGTRSVGSQARTR
jgi:hypothetical protein